MSKDFLRIGKYSSRSQNTRRASVQKGRTTIPPAREIAILELYGRCKDVGPAKNLPGLFLNGDVRIGHPECRCARDSEMRSGVLLRKFS